MNTKKILSALLAFFFLAANLEAGAQARQRHRSVTINQVVVDGKVVSADTIITETDTTTRIMRAKEVSMELPYTKGTTVHIENTYRKVTIRPSKDNVVRLATTAYYYGDSAFTNEQWLGKLNIQMQKTDTGITIRSGNITGNTGTGRSLFYSYSTNEPPVATASDGGQNQKTRDNTQTLSGRATVTAYGSARGYSYTNGTTVFNDQGAVFYSSGLKRELTVYLPAGAALNISSKYADVSVEHDVTLIRATITSASLDMAGAATATITSNYGNISTGNLGKATISLTSGKLLMKNADQLHLVTKYTKVEAGTCRILNMQSVSDDYDIDEVKELAGQQHYGSLRVDKLTGSVNLKAASADIKFRNIEPTVSAITIEDKYADVRLPVNALKNYEVAFSGQYSSVFAPFERKEATVGNETTANSVTTTAYGSGASGGSATSHRSTNNFTATVGDVKAAHTVFTLTCTSCNVDFK